MPDRFSFLAAAGTLFVLTFSASVSGCGGQDAPVVSHVEGRLTVSADVDSSDNYSGFEIVVVNSEHGDVDTLATATTDDSGSFSMVVRAQREGVYPFIVSRSGSTLSVDEFVAIDGDTVSVSGTYPLGSRSLRFRSPENAAWTAYRNTSLQHDRALAELLESESYTRSEALNLVRQSSSILWSIPESYPGTIGASLSRAESVIMLDGWDDPLILQRLPAISPENRMIAEVVRVGRKSIARYMGQDSSIAFIRDMRDRVPGEDAKAALQAELIVAYTDSLQRDEAVEAASELRRLYPESPWASWASRATYELENLMPGMPAPDFQFTTRNGQTFSLSDIGQGFVLLEFYRPLDDIFLRELPRRDRIVSALDGRILRAVSLSVEPDSSINEALFEERAHPGLFVYLPEGLDSPTARKYNVNVTPTRYLIDPDGRIVSKYKGPGIAALDADLAAVIQSLTDIQDRIPPAE